MEHLELDVCFSGEEIPDSFVKTAQNGLFSCCVSDLTLLQIEEPTTHIIKMQNKKAFEKDLVMQLGKDDRQTNKIMAVSLVHLFHNVEYLNLRSNMIGEHGAKVLANSVNLRKLKVLDLSGSHETTNIGKDGFLQFTSTNLLHFSNLTRLSLCQNSLDEESMISLITCDTFPKLRALDLFGNKLNSTAIELLVSSENTVSNLTDLNIGYNEYDSEAANFVAISPFLKNLTSLNMSGKVSFYGNYCISDVGVNVLFNSAYLENLTSLNLSNNQISDEGAKHIYNSDKLKNLTKINLNSNTLSSRGASYLAQSKCLANLKYLFLSFNLIESYGAKAICQHFKHLHELYLRGNRINNLGAREISESENLKNIKILEISLNRFGKEGLVHLSRSSILPPHVKIQFEERLALISRDFVEDIYAIKEESPSTIEIRLMSH